MIRTDVNVEIIVQVNGSRYVVEKDLDVPEDEFGVDRMSDERLKLADQMLDIATVEIRKAMGVPTREY